MTEMFGDLVPVAVLSRRTKAIFNTTVMGRDSRQFATRWRGQGVDQALIDRDALRREWLTERPHAGTFGLLQAAWLASG
jgi:asparagine synthase (glutamine-hydrolysing)